MIVILRHTGENRYPALSSFFVKLYPRCSSIHTSHTRNVKNHSGFTLIEIISVLIIIAVIALSVTAQTDTFANFHIESQTEIMKTHIRYAQNLSMYSKDSYGIAFISQNTYQFVKNTTANLVIIPGEESDTVTLSDTTYQTSVNEVFFDNLGRPKLANGTLLSTNTIITLTSNAINKTITITKNTGYVP